MRKIAGINGFGRFGLHLLKYWMDRSNNSPLEIKYINDDVLTIDQALEIIKNDRQVVFNKHQIKKIGSVIRFLAPCGAVHEIEYTTNGKESIPWLGRPDIFLECSGRNRVRDDCLDFYTGNTKLVAISATCWDADDTLVYGFNHKDYSLNHKIISYGSCTVNAYVPLAEYFNEKWGVKDSDVNVIHNIQEYCLADNYTLNRKFCTLEKSGPNLLGFVSESNFNVNYTIVPYAGVSIIDFRFRLQNCPSRDELIFELEHEFYEGRLKGMYGINEADVGPEVHNCTTFSSVFIKENIKVINNQVYLPAYFDNENSVNRYYDLLSYIAKQ